MNHFLKIISIIAFVPLVSAAQGLEIGMTLGVANYQGDMAVSEVNLGESRLVYGLFADYFFDPKFAASARFYNGFLAGDDANSDKFKDRGFSFSTQIREFSVQGVYFPFGREKYRYRNQFRPFITPKVFLGIGVMHGESQVVTDIPGDPRFPEEGDQDVFLVIPVGVGAHFAFSRHASLGAEIGWRTGFSDYIDGVSENGNSGANDWYMIGGVNLSVNIGSALLDQ